MKITTAAWALAAMLLAAPAAFADAPQPDKPVAVTLYSGRWYEVARTQNRMENGCAALTNDFSGFASGAFQVTQTCHKGAPNGPAQVMKVSGRVLPSSANAKMKLSMLGGLISQEYWIVDHADNNAWAIMATPAGHYVWLLARQPALSAADKAAAMGRLRALGFDLSKFSYLAP